jgi:Na+/H+ antiporter NhaC
MEEKKLTFFGGSFISFVPILVFVIVAVYIATTMTEITIQAMWVGILIGIIVTFFLARDKHLYGETIIKGMSAKVALVPVAAWIFAGIFATVLRSSGMVNGILWLAVKTGASGTAFVIVTFIACAIFGTAAGTGFGTIAAGMGVLYPAGVLLGAHPLLLAGAIIGGGAFGDNLAAISDTTISSAASQDTDIGGVVKSRLKYAFVAGSIAIVAMVIFGLINRGTVSAVPYEMLSSQMNPLGLIMFIPAIATIYFAVKTGNIIYSLIIGIALSIVFALVSGLNSFAGIFSVTDGAILNGVSGWMADLSILVILLSAGIHIMMDGGGGDALVAFGHKIVKKSVFGLELSTAILELIFSALMSINAPAILAVGLTFTKPLGDKFKLHPYRRANLLDGFACTLVYTLPWSAGVLFASGLSKAASEDFTSVPFLTPLQITPWVFYAWILLAVMFFAVFTGWGRIYIGADGKPTKEKPDFDQL